MMQSLPPSPTQRSSRAYRSRKARPRPATVSSRARLVCQAAEASPGYVAVSVKIPRSRVDAPVRAGGLRAVRSARNCHQFRYSRSSGICEDSGPAACTVNRRQDRGRTRKGRALKREGPCPNTGVRKPQSGAAKLTRQGRFSPAVQVKTRSNLRFVKFTLKCGNLRSAARIRPKGRPSSPPRALPWWS